MALSRSGIVLAAGLLWVGAGVAVAQSNSAPPLSYDQMQAAEKQAQAAKAEADAKAAKKSGVAEPAAEVPAAATPTAATPTAATPAATAADAAAAAPVAGTPVAGTPGSEPAAADVHPAAKVQYDKHGKPIVPKVKKEKPPKLVPVDIVHGELTVDGLIAKAGLNFQILDLKYLYIWVPGMGTAVISNQPFAGSKLQVNALDGSTLTVKVDGHQLQLACDGNMLDREAGKRLFQSKSKKEKAVSLYVALDTTYEKGSNYPELGYGDVNKAPYNWPGTLADLRPNEKAPPLPENLRQQGKIVKICAKNADGTQGACREVEVPLVLNNKKS